MDGLFIRICIIKCYQIFSHIYHHHRHHHCHCNPELSSAVGRFLILSVCMDEFQFYSFYIFAFSVNSRGIKGLSLGLLVFSLLPLWQWLSMKWLTWFSSLIVILACPEREPALGQSRLSIHI